MGPTSPRKQQSRAQPPRTCSPSPIPGNRLLGIQPPPLPPACRPSRRHHRPHLPNYHLLLLFRLLHADPHALPHPGGPPTSPLQPIRLLPLARYHGRLLHHVASLQLRLARVPDPLQQPAGARIDSDDERRRVRARYLCRVLDDQLLRDVRLGHGVRERGDDHRAAVDGHVADFLGHQ